MNAEQRVAFILSQVACMNAELEAMKVANLECASAGRAPVYNQNHFLQLADTYGLGHNSVVAFLQGSS